MAGMKGGKRLVGPSVVQKKSNGEKELEPRLARSAQWVQPRSMRKTHSSVDLPVSAEINAKTWVQRRRMRKTLAHFKINAIRSGPTQKYAQNSCSFRDGRSTLASNPEVCAELAASSCGSPMSMWVPFRPFPFCL